MKRATAAAGVVVLALLSSSCGKSLGDIRDVRAALNRTERVPHVIRYTDTTEERRVVVTLRVDDSFRSSAVLSMDGVPLLEQIASDDAAAVRLLAPDRWNPAAGTLLEPILGSGGWVLDPAGAPPVFFDNTTTAEEKGITAVVGEDPLADAKNAFEYVRAANGQSRGVIKFDKNSLSYRPSQDPFKGLVDADEQAGIKRYDAIPLVLQRTQDPQRGGGRIPDARTFRNLSVYVKDGRVVRVLERVDFERHEEFVKAQRKGKPRFLLNVLNSLRRGAGENPVRQRTMSIAVLSAGTPVQIKLPNDAVEANIGELLRSDALAKLPSPEGLKKKPAAA